MIKNDEDEGIGFLGKTKTKTNLIVLSCAIATLSIGAIFGRSSSHGRRTHVSSLGIEREISATSVVVPYVVERLPMNGRHRKIPRENFQEYVDECLRESPISGECTDFAAKKKIGTMREWDTSLIKDMGKAFENRVEFDGDLSAWDVSAVENFHWMFFNCREFNGDVRKWETKNARDMSGMFYNATKFTRKIGEWDTSQVTSMHAMFQFAKAFNKNILDWDTKKVTNSANMFKNATDFYKKFQCPFDSSVPSECVCKACVSQEEFSQAVDECLKIAAWCNCDNAPHGAIHLWDVSKVTDMNGAFENREKFGDGGISNWDVSAVTKMDNMFRNTVLFNGDISKWNVKNVQSMYRMFKNAKAFDQDIRGWDLHESIMLGGAKEKDSMTLSSSSSSSSSSSDDDGVRIKDSRWDMFTGAEAWNIKYGCPKCKQFEGPPSLWTMLNDKPPPSPPNPPPPHPPQPPYDDSQCVVPFKRLESCEDSLIHTDASGNEIKIPVAGFCAMKAAINRINKIECGYFKSDASDADTLDEKTTPSNLRSVGNYLDGLATLLETQVVVAPKKTIVVEEDSTVDKNVVEIDV